MHDLQIIICAVTQGMGALTSSEYALSLPLESTAVVT